MKNLITALIVLVVVGVGTYYLVFNKKQEVTPANTNNSYTPGISVDIKSFAFNPSTLTVKVGTKVTWTNNDSAPHTITSDSDNLLNSTTLSPGQSYSFTFTTPGTSNYHCTIHPSMKGSVIVEN